MIKIYGWRKSRAARCLWVLEELGVPYQHVALNHTLGETRTPEYLAINPSGKIPALDHDGFVLTETAAINFYLASVFPGTLLPSDAKGVAKLQQWTSWSLTDVEPWMVSIMREGRKPAEQVNQARIAAWRTDVLAMVGKILEPHLARQPQMLPGTGFTLADLNVASVLMPLPMLGVELADFPHIQAWLQRCLARDAWQRVQSLP